MEVLECMQDVSGKHGLGGVDLRLFLQWHFCEISIFVELFTDKFVMDDHVLLGNKYAKTMLKAESSRWTPTEL